MRKALFIIFFLQSAFSYAGRFGIGMNLGIGGSETTGIGKYNGGAGGSSLFNTLSFSFFDISYTAKRLYGGVRIELTGNGEGYFGYLNYRFNKNSKSPLYAGINAGYTNVVYADDYRYYGETGGNGYCAGIQTGVDIALCNFIYFSPELGIRAGTLKAEHHEINARQLISAYDINRNFTMYYLRFGIRFLIGKVKTINTSQPQ